MTKEHLTWLANEVPLWVKNEIITSEQSDRILSQYALDEETNEPKVAETWSPGIVALSVLGALMIGGGLLLILANQWEHFSLFWKQVMSFLPIVTGLSVFVYAYVRQLGSIAWREGASGFFMVMVAASLGLVIQTFQLESKQPDTILIWLVASLPIIYVANSSLAAIVYLIGALVWQADAIGNEKMIYWLLFLAIVPHLWLNLRQPIQQPIRRNLLVLTLALTWPFAWFPNYAGGIPEYSILTPTLALGIYMMVSRWVYPNEKPGFLSPLFLTGYLGVFIYTLVLSQDMSIQAFSIDALWSGRLSGQYWGWSLLCQLFLVFLLWLVLMVNYFRKSQITTIGETLLILFPVFALTYITLYRLDPNVYTTTKPYINHIPLIFANLYGLSVGIAFIRQGIAKPGLVELNLGMLFILGLAASRFFDSEWNELYKGLAFVALGVVFLIVNLRLGRRMK
jgi:hypothetical protein